MVKKLEIIKEQEILGKGFRIYGTFENPLFLAKDVAEWIEHSNVSKMIKDSHLSDEDLTKITISYNGDGTRVSPPLIKLFLTEDGLYEVLMQSRLPIAKEFKKEVKKILKDVRKHGMYATDELVNNPDLLIQVATQLKKEREEKKLLQIENEEKQAKIEADKPKVDFANTVNNSSKSLSLGQYAKALYDENGVDVGRNRLFQWFRDKSYLMHDNVPYQQYMKYFKVIYKPYFDYKTETEEFRTTTLINGKGQLYFFDKIKNHFGLKYK